MGVGMPGIMDRHYWPATRLERVAVIVAMVAPLLTIPWIGAHAFVPAFTVLFGWAGEGCP